jgi:type I restriction enzyme M protein
LFTGDAGQGESNARRYMIENDLVEAIIALPENMFYNTGICTFIWVLSNRKAPQRRGKLQLIDATSLNSILKKNLGKRNCEITVADHQYILDLFLNMTENEYSRVFDNAEFGYWKVVIQHPQLDASGNPKRDSKGKLIVDKSKTDTEQIPFTYQGGVSAFIENEVKHYAPLAWVDENQTKIGYAIRFTKYFKRKIKSDNRSDIKEKIHQIESMLSAQIEFMKEQSYPDYADFDEIWLSELPQHWKAIKIKHLFTERVEKGYPNEPLLAATQNMGVVPKEVYGQRTVLANKNFESLKLVRKGDYVISLRSFQGGIERAHYQGIISPAYTVITPHGIEDQYFKYLAKSKAFIELLKQCVTGIREGQNIDYSTLRNIRIPVPPVEEQLQIGLLLDSIGIDARINTLRKEINLLEEYKAIIVSDVVTGKVDVRGVVTQDYKMIDLSSNSDNAEEEVN